MIRKWWRKHGDYKRHFTFSEILDDRDGFGFEASGWEDAHENAETKELILHALLELRNAIRPLRYWAILNGHKAETAVRKHNEALIENNIAEAEKKYGPMPEKIKRHITQKWSDEAEEENAMGKMWEGRNIYSWLAIAGKKTKLQAEFEKWVGRR